jgi:hypothetical protein
MFDYFKLIRVNSSGRLHSKSWMLNYKFHEIDEKIKMVSELPQNAALQ